MEIESFKGKPVFEVNMLDFLKIATRTEKRTKFNIENEALLEHIKNTRYSKNYVVEYGGIMIDASLLSNPKNSENE